MSISFYQDDPLRTPRWRADLAVKLVDRTPGMVIHARDDKYVRQYHRFLLKIRTAGEDNTQCQDVQRKMPKLYETHRFYWSQDHLSRAIIEAFLLTNESFDQIAKHCGLDALFVKYCEALYFNTRDRLEASDWILKTILDSDCNSVRSASGTMTADDVGVLMRLLAYRGGALVLKHIIGAVVPEKSQGIKNRIVLETDTTAIQAIQLRALSSLKHFSPNGRNALRLMRAAIKARTAEPKPAKDMS